MTEQPLVAVRLRGLRKQFGAGAHLVTAVDGVDLDVNDGEFITLLGPSGSGKTTVLRMIAGFELPTAGTIELDGVDVTRRAPFERDVNTVFQDYALFPHMTVQENVAYGLRVKKVGRAERTKRAQEALESVRLGEYGGRTPAQMSGGQRQAVAIARTRLSEPKIVLMDEPTAAISVRQVAEVLSLIRRLRDHNIAVILISHRMPDVFAVADRIVVMRRGEKVADKPIGGSSPEEVTGLITGAIETA